MKVEVSKETLDAVPEAARNRACICQSCIAGFPRNFRLPRTRGFTLIELLMAVAIIGILSGLLLPALAGGKRAGQRAKCLSSLRQLGVAAQMYWDDNSGNCFPYLTGITNGGSLYWFGWLQDGAEGSRVFDPSQGAMFDYLKTASIRVCPSLDYHAAYFKAKAIGASYGYGYNATLSSNPKMPPVSITRIKNPSGLVLLADTAQVNDFQAPASSSNPMLEEWYYLDNPTNMGSKGYYPHAHFRHAKKANTVSCDGHAETDGFMAGSIDTKMPSQFVGRLRPETVLDSY